MDEILAHVRGRSRAAVRVAPGDRVKRLREILDADGEDYKRPSHLGDDDEWDVGDAS